MSEAGKFLIAAKCAPWEDGRHEADKSFFAGHDREYRAGI
jgi:hypothetical protein